MEMKEDGGVPVRMEWLTAMLWLYEAKKYCMMAMRHWDARFRQLNPDWNKSRPSSAARKVLRRRQSLLAVVICQLRSAGRPPDYTLAPASSASTGNSRRFYSQAAVVH